MSSRPGEGLQSRSIQTLMVIAMAVLLAGVCWALMASAADNWSAVWRYRGVFVAGWFLTIGISVGALILSLVVGLALALLRRSPAPPVRALATVLIETVRGSPLLVLILFLYYVVADRLGLENRLAVGIVILSLFSGAYIAEVIRAGIESVGASQLESARAIGLTVPQTYRFVIFPQAVRQTMPPLAGQFASLIKDSSLLSIIGIAEFTFAAQQVNSATYSTLESYAPLLAGYLVLTIPVSLGSKWLEERFRYET